MLHTSDRRGRGLSLSICSLKFLDLVTLITPPLLKTFGCPHDHTTPAQISWVPSEFLRTVRRKPSLLAQKQPLWCSSLSCLTHRGSPPFCPLQSFPASSKGWLCLGPSECRASSASLWQLLHLGAHCLMLPTRALGV